MDKLEELRARADEVLAADDDHMVATGEALAWLIAQIVCWPVRVDEERTTNDRFLRMSAAATLLADADEITRLNAEVERAWAVAEEAAKVADRCAREYGVVFCDNPAAAVRDEIRALILKARGKDANVG